MPAVSREVVIQWRDDGTLGGDREVAGMLRAFAASVEGNAVGPIEGPYTYRDHLKSGLSAVMLIDGLFERVDEWIGEVPRRFSPPEIEG